MTSVGAKERDMAMLDRIVPDPFDGKFWAGGEPLYDQSFLLYWKGGGLYAINSGPSSEILELVSPPRKPFLARLFSRLFR